MTHLGRQLRTLSQTDQFQALGHLGRLVDMLPAQWEQCDDCGSLEPTWALACGSCGRSVTDMPDAVVVDSGATWLPLMASAQAIGRQKERNALRRLPAVCAERERRRLEDAFLRSVAADARTADLLARRWLFLLDSEVAGGGE